MHYILNKNPSCASVRVSHSPANTYILDRQLAKCRVGVRAQRRFRHRQLLGLQLDNLVLDRILNDQFDDLNWTFLAESVDSVHRLVLDRRVPLHVSYHT